MRKGIIMKNKKGTERQRKKESGGRRKQRVFKQRPHHYL